MKYQPDVIDHKILDQISRNGRISTSDLAEEIGLSRPAISERIEKLEKHGYIRGYTGVIQSSDHSITAFIAARHPGLLMGRAEQAVYDLNKKPEILEVHGVAGEDCLYLKVRVKDVHDLNRLVKELQQKPLLMETKTTIVLNTYFEKVGGVLLMERPKEKGK